MIKKTVALLSAITFFVLFSIPAQAQFGKKLGKSLEKAAKGAGDAVVAVAGDAATDIAANKVSDKIIDFMDQNNKIADPSSEYYKRLAALVGTKYVSVDGLSLTYQVYETEEANILALTNGNIRVYSGMMDLLSDDELTAAIAIQIGHIVNKDVRNALTKVASEDNATTAATAQLEKMLSFSGDKLGSIINELIQVPYSEDQNKAADSYAYALLEKQGSNVSGLTSLLDKLGTLEESDKVAMESESEEAELSPAAKYIGVNANNSTRASLMRSK